MITQKETANSQNMHIMTQRLIKFTKMHGAGNDYIYVDTRLCPVVRPAEASRLWSDRHKGIGADGLVLIGAARERGDDFSMRIFNADGSEAMMCGNASRCVGKYVYEKGLTRKTEIRLETLSGVKTLGLHVEGGAVTSVTVDMLAPRFEVPAQYDPRQCCGAPGRLEAGGEEVEGTFVSMGNPHFVVFTDDLSDSRLRSRLRTRLSPSFTGSVRDQYRSAICMNLELTRRRAFSSPARDRTAPWLPDWALSSSRFIIRRDSAGAT